MDERISVAITADPISPADLAAMHTSDDGALVIFSGVVRSATSGRAVTSLDYESYDEMATGQIRTIAEQAVEKFEIGRVTIVHRTGHLDVGECSVVVGVSAPHRGAAFDACEFCIDTLKQTAAIWKKENFADGEAHWVEHP